MIATESKILITQAEYAKKLRPLMPPEAFLPDINKLWILLINIAILIMGWNIASHLNQWNWYYLWLYLPMALIMANSVIVLSTSTHDLLHNSAIKNQRLKWIISVFALTMDWMPPTLWKVLHNREHHNKTNSLQDPDRNYLYEQPNSWGKWFQNLFIPSQEVSPLLLIVGMGFVWIFYAFRNISSVLIFNNGLPKYIPAAFQVTSKERKAIAIELLIMISIHLSILTYLQFNPINLILGYFLPLWLGHSGLIFYIYNHHLVCRMTSVNDPLLNTISIRVPKIFDVLHLNFSYHTEHHIFPHMNSDYYPQLQELLKTQYPERFNLLDVGEAWHLLLNTPRHYKDETTFTDWYGQKSVTCPLSASDKIT